MPWTQRILATCMVVLAWPVAQAQSLTELEGWARESAPEHRLADLELQALDHRLRAIEADGGGRLFGGLSVADAREAVTDTTTRNYQRLTAQVGARWSLVGAARARERAATDARATILAARLRQSEATLLVRQRLRTAYLDAWYATERVRWSESFLAGEPEARRWLGRRTQAHLLLESDRLSFLSMFELARREQARHQAAFAEAVRRLERLTGHNLSGFQPTAAQLTGSCLSHDEAINQGTQRPAMALAKADVQAWRERAQVAGDNGLEAGVSVAQSISKDFGGPNGRATTLGVDLSVPFAADRLRTERRSAALVEVQRAEALLALRQADDRNAVEEAYAARDVRRRDLASSRRQLDAAFEAWRVAGARVREMDGDVLERELQTRYALYQAAMDFTAARQRLEQAEADWLAFAPDVACQPGQEGPIQQLPVGLEQALRPRADRTAKSRMAATDLPPLGWFIWQAAPWLESPPWKQLPSDTQRLAISFDARQLDTLPTDPAMGMRLQRLLAQAHQRGLTVEWLLGEPTWVREADRARLLTLLRSMERFGFDAINLDLERSQLPEAEQGTWADAVVATVAEVRSVSAWPVVLTTHHREFADTRLVERLRAAGLSEGVAMVYVTGADRLDEIVNGLRGLALPLAIAQSIEPQLPDGESHARAGRQAALQAWRALGRKLATPGAVQPGVFVQSWEAFQEARP